MFNTLRGWLANGKPAGKPARGAAADRRTRLRFENLEQRVVLDNNQVYPSISPDLENLFNNYAVYGGAPGSFGFAYTENYFRGDKVKVTVRGREATNWTALNSFLGSVGFEQVAIHNPTKQVVGFLPMDKVDDVASYSTNPAVLLNVKPKTWSVGAWTNTAEEVQRADLVRNAFGLTGAGITIGIISDSINQVGNGVFDSFKSGDLPNIGPQLQILDDTLPGADEGRAMAELIHDIAPNARILFHTSGSTDVEYAQAIRRLADAGANIIVDDITVLECGWFQEPLVGQAVQDVYNNQNVLYFSAAANAGDSGWQTPFRGSDDTAPSPTFSNLTGIWHSFGRTVSPGGVQNDIILQQVVIPPQSGINLQFWYDDPTVGGEGLRRDVDIYLFNDMVNGILASGTSNNFATLRPYENLIYNNNSQNPVTGFIGIRMVSGYDIGYFQYIDFMQNLIIVGGTPGVANFPNPVPNAMIATIPGAQESTLETIAVGAIEELTGVNQMTSYSSYGPGVRVFDNAGNRLPAPVLIPGADLSATSGNRTSVVGFRPFSGTSAAAPNAAASAALIWEFNRAMTNQQVKELIYSTAVDLINPHPTYSFGFTDPNGTNLPGFDRYSGIGLVDTGSAVIALNNRILTVTGDRGGFRNDNLTIRVSSDPRFANSVDLVLNGVRLGSVRRSEFFNSFVFDGGAFNDTLNVDVSNGNVNTTFRTVYIGGSETDTIQTIGNSDYTLAFDNLAIGTLLPIELRGIENANLAGGAGANTFTLLNWIGQVVFDGAAGGDTYNLNLSGGVDNISIIDSGGVASGTDTVNLNGTAGDDAFVVRLRNTGREGTMLNGAFESITYGGIEGFDVNGAGGTNSLTLIDETGLNFGSPTNLAAGFVYAPIDAGAGRLRNGTANTTTTFRNFVGGFSFTGDGNNTGARDTFTVLGVTSTGSTVSALGETVSDDGNDTIRASADGVTISNGTLGTLRGVALAGIANLFINGGNEAALGGDNIFATPNGRTNIFVDGGNPTGLPGDSLTVDTVGVRTQATNVNNPNLGPVGHDRIFQSLDDGSVGYVNVERVGGTNRADTAYATVTGAGTKVLVTVYDGVTNKVRFTFNPYAEFTGGARVAVGDVTGDGVMDIITVPGAGAPSHVLVTDGKARSAVQSFFAYDPRFLGGVSLATGDVNGDNRSDIITGAGPGGGPHVQVFSGLDGSPMKSFFAYVPQFTGGVSVAAGDFNSDGRDDIVLGAGPGGGPHVRVVDSVTNLDIRSFFAYAPNFTGGVNVATGDLNKDGVADIVTTTATGGVPHVKVLDGASLTELASFYFNDAFSPDTYVPEPKGAIVSAAVFDSSGFGDRKLILSKGFGSRPKASIYTVPVGITRDLVFADTSFGGGIYVGGSA